tara:strand:- start:757 stop:1809 length:1053 start_codon:yes stop_codon:yes gene_type:complete
MNKYIFNIISLLFVFNISFSQTKIGQLNQVGDWIVTGTLNGSKFDFVFDNNQSDVLISSELFSYLKKQAIVSDNDILERKTYADANGYLNEVIFINIREIVIAGYKVTNVKASVSSSIKSPLLLGQAFLSRFPSFTQTNDGFIVMDIKQPNTSDKKSILDNTKSKNNSKSVSNIKRNSKASRSILLYEINNNIPINITYLTTPKAGTGMYIGCGFKSGEKPTSSGIYMIEDGDPVLYYGDESRGSFGPLIDRDESVYMLNIGVNQRLKSPFWLSFGLSWERSIVVEKRDHFFSTGEYWTTQWIENKDESADKIFVEADIYLKIFDLLVVKYGINLKDNVRNSAIGIGLSF